MVQGTYYESDRSLSWAASDSSRTSLLPPCSYLSLGQRSCVNGIEPFVDGCC
jgi:hypothetical protein